MLLRTQSTLGMRVARAAAPAAASSAAAGRGAPAPPRPPVSTIRYFGIAPPPRIPWLAVLLSAALHATVLLSYRHHVTVRKAAAREEPVEQMLMMPILDQPDEVKPKDLSDDDPVEAPSISVPMLADIPTLAPSSSTFIQQLDLTIPMKSDPNAGRLVAIPVNIQRGRPDDSAIKNLFNISDLDRRPEPIVQTQPNYPFEMKRQGLNGTVRVGFIVDSQGNVILPYIISSSSREFEGPTIDAVLRWKFRPGMKGGRKVNTRVEQPVSFTVKEGEAG